ncbi:hypothetical protein HOY80DRAFT_1049382 [Tuber brumale]|nr:hypothetical protein HOY80DRAFT_1049382 [Tuber brumale]
MGQCKALSTLLILRSNVYLCQWATWQHLPPQVQKKLLEDTKKQIKCLLRENGVNEDHESRTDLEDLVVEGYLDLAVSDDEESESEDNLDPEAGVETLNLPECQHSGPAALWGPHVISEISRVTSHN